MGKYSMAKAVGALRRLRTLMVGSVALLGLALLLAGCAPTPVALAQPQPEEEVSFERQITVSGTGVVEATPDVATVTVGVQTEAETAGEAITENNEEVQSVIDALVEAGIDEDDIQTQTIQLNPRYDEPRRPEDRGQRELVGFTATNLVNVTVQEIDTVGEVLDAAVEAGANRIQNINFEVTDPAALLEEAREAAWNDAEAKAEQLADLADAELGPVITINETSRGRVPVARDFADEEAAAAVPIQPGSQTIEVGLQVTWALQ